MKKLFLTLVIALSCSPAYSANLVSDYIDAVAVEVMVRQVIVKQLLPASDSNFYEILLRALEGSDNPELKYTFTTIHCERTLGSDLCTISIVGGSDYDNEGHSFDINITVREGKITSATISDFIG